MNDQKRSTILLTKEGCDLCDLARNYLKKRQIDHVEIDSKHQKGQAVKYKLPTLFIYGTAYQGIERIRNDAEQNSGLR